MQKYLKEYLPLLPALIIFALIARYLNFTQDDAYISYRYVANFLSGHGLVYNIGERIEGYTNFGWVVYLILWGGLGLSYIVVSKITGLLLGAGLIVVTYLTARELFDEQDRLLSIIPAYLVAGNLSLAYWSPAGLETAAFAFVTALSIYWYLRRSNLLIAGLLLAVWIRPEGAVVTGLLIFAELITFRRLPSFTLRSAVIAFIFSLPYLAFKWSYYGSIIPNPFYAKTRWDMVHLTAGIQYAWEFLRDYGLFGAGLIIPLVFFKRLSTGARGIWLIMLGYTAYIVAVGGDVLKIHRFFLPVCGLSATLLVLSITAMAGRAARATVTLMAVLLALVTIGLSIYLPYKTVLAYDRTERGFTAKMAAKAVAMRVSDSTDFSVAVPTIGAFGYELLGHDIIDMVGLTDSTIARHAEPPIPGMESSWKEKKHNSRYLLERAPDYIVFSTGVKPSAPAEKALLMYSAFQRSYRAVTWYYRADASDVRGSLNIAYRKMRPVTGPIVPDYPVQYVEEFVDGAQSYVSGKAKEAIAHFERAMATAPDKPQFVELLHLLGTCYGATEGNPKGVEILNKAVAQDSLAFGPHRELYLYEKLYGDPGRAEIHHEYLERLVPWYVPRIDSLVNYRVEHRGGGPSQAE